MESQYFLYDTQEKKRTEYILSKPKNGWPNLDKYLKENDLAFDLKLDPEEQSPPLHPDSLYFIIEARSGLKYQMFWYIMNTRTASGKKVQNLCDKIGGEFGIKFSCRY